MRLESLSKVMQHAGIRQKSCGLTQRPKAWKGMALWDSAHILRNVIDCWRVRAKKGSKHDPRVSGLGDQDGSSNDLEEEEVQSTSLSDQFWILV